MIIFFYGENDYKIRRKTKELKDKFIKEVDPSAYNIFVLDGKNTNLAEINEKISPQSLLSSKRMIIIEDLFLNKNKDLLDEAYSFFTKKENIKEGNIIIFNEKFVKTKKIGQKTIAQIIDSSGKEKNLLKKEAKLFKYLSEQKFQQEFKNFSNTEATAWIKSEAERSGALISNKAAQALVGLAGNDLWRLDNELKKLIGYKLNKNDLKEKIEISENDIAEMVKGGFDENIFLLTDAIGANNKGLAMSLVEDQIKAGLGETYLMSMIVRQFRIILQVKQGLESGSSPRKINSDLGLHSFIVQKGISQAKNFTLEKIKKIINRLAEIDYLMKTGQADMKVMIDLLILKI